MTEEQIKSIVEEAVKQTLLKMGVNIASGEDAIELQKDMQHLRKWRVGVDALNAKAAFAIIATLISGTAAAVWMGLKSALGGGSHS